MPKQPSTKLEPTPHMEIDNLETLRVLSDPFRIQILMNLMAPVSVKEIAKQLNVPATKLYYHINLLEQHGVIRVVDTRVISGIIEKQYHVTAYSFGPKPGLVSATGGMSEIVTMLENGLESTKLDLRRAYNAGLIDSPNQDASTNGEGDLEFTRGVFSLTAAQAKDFRQRLKALLKETWDLWPDPSKTVPGAMPYTFTMVFHRAVDARPSKASRANKTQAGTSGPRKPKLKDSRKN